MKTDKVRSDVIFFRLINTSIRNKVIEDLLSLSYGEDFDVYWHGAPGAPGLQKKPGLFTHIKALDEQRNKIVHWHTVRYFEEDAKYKYKFPREILKKATSSDIITPEELELFCDKARVITRAIELFIEFVSGREINRRAPLPHIFQQPLPYPPLDTHPLFQTWKELQSEPRSSHG